MQAAIIWPIGPLGLRGVQLELSEELPQSALREGARHSWRSTRPGGSYGGVWRIESIDLLGNCMGDVA
eukprot:3022245-Heterocapsa_arctica.AAC.1